MQKIKDLHEFIIGLNLFAAEQMDSWVDDLKITPSSWPSPVAGQIVLAEKDYTATFFIERYPHGQVTEDALIAQISAWFLANDMARIEDTNFPVIIDVLDKDTANLEFGIPFTELVIAEENLDGTILIEGVRYSLV